MAIYTKGRRMRAFISGPITGVPDYMEKFSKAHIFLDSIGYEPINPALVTYRIPDSLGMDWEEYMSITLLLLKHCDAVCMLEGWSKSPGAKIEHIMAQKLGLKIMYLKDIRDICADDGDAGGYMVISNEPNEKPAEA